MRFKVGDIITNNDKMSHVIYNICDDYYGTVEFFDKSKWRFINKEVTLEHPLNVLIKLEVYKQFNKELK